MTHMPQDINLEMVRFGEREREKEGERGEILEPPLLMAVASGLEALVRENWVEKVRQESEVIAIYKICQRF